MAYCPSCGESVRDDQDVCLSCGAELKEKKVVYGESGSYVGWGILSFLLPLAGLILFLVWKDSKPKGAKICGTWALIGFVINLIVFSSL
ncbi:MAG: zinc ribbon domain-containing protein [Acholeplasmataceae bacterium]|nr:zinc ribbon domain-containing protein [Acholeplasmataceae bacterium]